MPAEASVYLGINKWLKEIDLPEDPCNYRKRHGCIYSQRGDSDFLVLYRALHFEIEVKKPGEEPTRDQWIRLIKCHKAGGVAGIAKSVEEFKAIIAHGLKRGGAVRGILRFPERPMPPKPPRTTRRTQQEDAAQAEIRQANLAAQLGI